MLQISRNSWHYRLLKKMYVTPPKNLCAYFWTVVGQIMLLLFAMSVCGFLVYILLIPILCLFGLNEPILGLIISSCELIFVSLFLFLKYKPMRKLKLENTLVFQYVKAKKQKICPLIQYVE